MQGPWGQIPGLSHPGLTKTVNDDTFRFRFLSQPHSFLNRRPGASYLIAEPVFSPSERDQQLLWWSVVRNPPGRQDRRYGFDPWSGKIPQAVGIEAHAPQLLSLCSGAQQPQLLSPRDATTEAPGPSPAQQEKPLHQKAQAPQPEGSPCSPELGKSPQSEEDEHCQNQINRTFLRSEMISLQEWCWALTENT